VPNVAPCEHQILPVACVSRMSSGKFLGHTSSHLAPPVWRLPCSAAACFVRDSPSVKRIRTGYCLAARMRTKQFEERLRNGHFSLLSALRPETKVRFRSDSNHFKGEIQIRPTEMDDFLLPESAKQGPRWRKAPARPVCGRRGGALRTPSVSSLSMTEETQKLAGTSSNERSASTSHSRGDVPSRIVGSR
jgi:hypothetical protein